MNMREWWEGVAPSHRIPIFLVTLAIATLFGGRAGDQARRPHPAHGGGRGVRLARLRPAPTVAAHAPSPREPGHRRHLGRLVPPVVLRLPSRAIPCPPGSTSRCSPPSPSLSVLATMMFHERIHVARVVPVVPGVFGIAVFAMVNVASVAAAIVASG